MAMTKEERLAALKEKIASTNVGGGGAGFWSPPQGATTVRILPEVGDMPFFYQEAGQHYLPDRTQVTCPNFTSEGDLPCPICELVSELYRGTEADKKMAGELRVRKSYWMNIVVRKAGDRGGDTAEGPFIFTPGVTIFTDVASLIANPDYGDITDPEDGFDITITRTGEKMETKYSVVARRMPNPLHVDNDEFNRILDTAADLLFVELSDNSAEDKELSDGFVLKLKPYDRIIRDYGVEPGMNAAALNAKAVDADPKQSVKQTLAARKTRRAEKNEEPDADVVDEPDDDVADEPEGDAQVDEAFAQSRTRRRTRRATK